VKIILLIDYQHDFPLVSNNYGHKYIEPIRHKYTDIIQWHFHVPFKVITLFDASWYRTCNFNQNNTEQSFRNDLNDLNAHFLFVFFCTLNILSVSLYYRRQL